MSCIFPSPRDNKRAKNVPYSASLNLNGKIKDSRSGPRIASRLAKVVSFLHVPTTDTGANETEEIRPKKIVNRLRFRI